MRGKSWIIVCVVLLIIGVLLFLFRDKILRKKTEVSGSDGTEAAPVSEFPLQSGSRGEKVSKLQRYLNNIIQQAPVVHNQLVVDGMFGPKTAEACGIAFGVYECSEANYKAFVEPYKG